MPVFGLQLLIRLAGVEQTPALLTCAGLAPNTVWLHQFNFIVPQVANGDSPIEVKAGDLQVKQVLYLSVQQ
jgi:uncharacterized protein (TIGR03437 family)